jgi:capsular polysaccharide transport system permease protein
MVISTAFASAGLMPAPDDILKMMIAWILLAWFSLCMGMLVGSAAARYESVDRVWHVFTYLFLPMSGAFFMVDWIPTRFQGLALLVPTVDCTELLRDGYFGRVVHAHYDLSYLVALNVVLTLIAIVAVRRIAHLVEG